MRIVGILFSLVLILFTLFDAFETILQPRRVTHRFRFARLFYRSTWRFWRLIALRFSPGKRREAFLSVFGPMSLLGLFVAWIIGLIFGFALLHCSLGTVITGPDGVTSFWTDLYLSGSTFFTLGYGDVTPMSPSGRLLAVIESGLGFGFLAVLISYLPVLYQAYSKREVAISLLDARAGSPPSAAQFLARIGRSGSLAQLDSLLAEWEPWAAELLESHLSFPVLSYYRSQHDNQSWLAALTTILDTCAILIVEVKHSHSYRAQLTFAMARHAAVDLSLVLKASTRAPGENRLPPDARVKLQKTLKDAGFDLHALADGEARLNELRGMYEPFVEALARRFMFTLPPIVTDEAIVDNWQRAPGMPRAPGIGSLPPAASDADPEHF